MLHATNRRATHELPASGSSTPRLDLLAVVAHDLQQPMTAALIATEFADELLEHASSPAMVRQQLSLATRCMRETIQLARDLLAMDRAATGVLRLRTAPVDLQALLADACALVGPQARAKGITLHVNVAPALPRLTADRDRLLQVLTNVCGNAIHFTMTGGSVQIAASLQHDVVRVSVTDTGPGIAADDLVRVFDRGWQGQRPERRSGNGLGLTIAKWLVEAHGGAIAAERAVGRGLEVSFTVPLEPCRGAYGQTAA